MNAFHGYQRRRLIGVCKDGVSNIVIVVRVLQCNSNNRIRLGHHALRIGIAEASRLVHTTSGAIDRLLRAVQWIILLDAVHNRNLGTHIALE